MSAVGSRDVTFDLRDRAGRFGGLAPRCAVFPESREPEKWRPSRSNGVALHTSWSGACARAAGELVERDRVLRSWYGDSAPARRVLPDALIPHGLRALAEWAAYELTAPARAVEQAWTVVVVVGVPLAETTPIAYGFAAKRDAPQAVEAAAAEAVQRFGFLYGEEIPARTPEPSPTPDFHQEFFLHPPAHTLLRAWLDGGPSGTPATGDPHSRPRTEGGSWFADLTPLHLRGTLFVAKALCGHAEPLVFGEPAPHRTDADSSRRVHPIA
jgi:ribosomal protein S12 methylthiotransferase accessory factor YcaO